MNVHNYSYHNSRQQARIPATLQAVFLASNRGEEVNKPPPASVASKVFFHNWLFQRQAESNESDVPSFLKTKKVKKLKKKTKQESPKGAALLNISSTQPNMPIMSPQTYLDAMIRSQGYSTKKFSTLQSAYHNKPTPLQQASYHAHLIDVVKAYDYDLLESILGAGVSPNPCNSFGESLVHMVSRRGDAKALHLMIEHGCSVQVADDYGRTPLHDCCGWAATPAFDVAEYILECDVRLLHMTDCRGATPLSYVRKEHWGFWIEFLEHKKDIFWPQRDLAKDGEEEPPALAMLGAYTQPLTAPANALSLELTDMVVSGKMRADEVLFLKYVQGDKDTWDLTSEDDNEYDSDGGSEFDDDTSFDTCQMDDVLSNLSIQNSNSVCTWQDSERSLYSIVEDAYT
jgi:ankyrin repeat protein